MKLKPLVKRTARKKPGNKAGLRAGGIPRFLFDFVIDGISIFPYNEHVTDK